MTTPMSSRGSTTLMDSLIEEVIAQTHQMELK